MMTRCTLWRATSSSNGSASELWRSTGTAATTSALTRLSRSFWRTTAIELAGPATRQRSGGTEERTAQRENPRKPTSSANVAPQTMRTSLASSSTAVKPSCTSHSSSV